MGGVYCEPNHLDFANSGIVASALAQASVGVSRQFWPPPAATPRAALQLFFLTCSLRDELDIRFDGRSLGGVGIRLTESVLINPSFQTD